MVNVKMAHATTWEDVQIVELAPWEIIVIHKVSH